MKDVNVQRDEFSRCHKTMRIVRRRFHKYALRVLSKMEPGPQRVRKLMQLAQEAQDKGYYSAATCPKDVRFSVLRGAARVEGMTTTAMWWKWCMRHGWSSEAWFRPERYIKDLEHAVA